MFKRLGALLNGKRVAYVKDLKMAEKKYDCVVYIGRFQPFHNGHLAALEQAAEVTNNLFMCIGSSGAPISPKNPFTLDQRARIVKPIVHDMFKAYNIVGLSDHHDDAKWAKEIVTSVMSHLKTCGIMIPSEAKVAILGNPKDESHIYEKWFTTWDFIPLKEKFNLHATQVRQQLFDGIINISVPSNTFEFLKDYSGSSNFKHVKEQHDAIVSFKKDYEDLPYPPIFVTADILLHNQEKDEVLLVKRKGPIGKGLWAMPGGFVNHDEKIIHAARRELEEETGITNVVFTDYDMVDHPSRSQLGRIITHVFVEQSNVSYTPIAGDDADEARYWPRKEITRDMMYEDHFHIIDNLLGDQND